MSQPTTPQPVGYEAAIRSLFALLATANFADSDEKQPWQKSQDSSEHYGLYGHVRAAIISIAGEMIVRHWEQTNELFIELADRK